MTTIYLVRHGKAAAGFDEDMDPPLDKIGTKQALDMANILGPKGPLPLVASPMRRCRETASALEHAWGAPARIDERVTEVPTPAMSLSERRVWITEFMQGTWADEAAAAHVEWRKDVLSVLDDITEDTVISSHFVAINTLVGALNDDARIISFRPDNCSITRLEKGAEGWHVAELGRQVVTEVL